MTRGHYTGISVIAIAAITFFSGRASVSVPEPSCGRCFAKEATNISVAMSSLFGPDGGLLPEDESRRRQDERIEASGRKDCVDCMWNRGNENPDACEARCVRAGSNLFRPTADGCICQDGSKHEWDWGWCVDEPIDCEQFGLPPVGEFGLLDPRWEAGRDR